MVVVVMTRKELFSTFPRPWQLCEDDPGVVLAADGGDVLTVDSFNTRPDEPVVALAELIVELVNATAE